MYAPLIAGSIAGAILFGLLLLKIEDWIEDLLDFLAIQWRKLRKY